MLKDHLNKLEYFCIIVEAKSILKASKVAYISQPQLSKVVKQLEDDLGQKLFIRISSGVKTTAAGMKLYEFAKSVILGANETQLLISSDKKVNGVVRIGTYDSISRYFFPDFLKFLQKSLPNVKVILSAGRSSEIIKKLKKDIVNIAIIVGDFQKTKKLHADCIYSDAFGFYSSTSISLPFKEHLIIFRDSLKKKDGLSNEFGFKHFLECDNLETVKSLCEQGVGIGLLPHKVAREGVLSGKLILEHSRHVPHEISPHDIFLINKVNKLSDADELVKAELKRFLTHWSLK